MQKEFLSYITKEELFSKKDQILLAVSGGIDSVVMCELFYKAGVKFGIAHCNFKLRGEESDEDELFVRSLSEKFDVPFHTKAFSTTGYSEKKKLSIQAAARELRYTWFESLREKHNYSYIAIAQHSDDSIETFFINLLRGAGIAGLHGILPKQGYIIRPLLFTNKEGITRYAKKKKLQFREDSSNASEKYLRNKIRKKIIPAIKELNPKIDSILIKDIQHLREVEQIFRKEIENQKEKLTRIKDSVTCFDIEALKKLSPLGTYLFELLKPYGFTGAVVNEIITALDGIPGKQFFSPTHRIIKDRKELILQSIASFDKKTVKVSVKKNQKIAAAGDLKLMIRHLPAGTKFSRTSRSAALDIDKMKFPLTIRKWKPGDAFMPFGMKGKKKLSDFFIDSKIPVSEKENIQLLVSGNEIAWVIGHRIDERFKVTEKTKKIYFAELTE
ncbi:MAG TPA: tRNA lysidine(34) synthetase TilS [Bacteroidia bacterium]|jgi:tRNA(Ile)-lysidine synthase